MSSKVLQNQHYLWKCLERIFPHYSIEVNARNTIKNNTGGWLELDLGIRDLNLGFEFQDAYHYITQWYYQQRVSSIQESDKTKHDILRNQEMTLITIPCWWDGSINSLQGTILFARPDLAMHGRFPPITLNPSTSVFDSFGVPGVGELMLASFPQPTYAIFRKKITESEPWWLGEKYDGVRCCWSPKHRHVYSRRGIIFYIPRRYLRWFPNMFLDGEFWFGRSSIDAYQIMRHVGPDWQFCRIPTFDTPLPQHHHTPFEARYATLLSILKPRHPFLVIATRIFTTSAKQLSVLTKKVLSDGGEGTILRKYQSLYENGRSASLIKIKAYSRDMEAIVLEVTDKNWLKLKLPSGIVFKIPPNSVEVRSYPKKGDIVMITYEKVSNLGTPVEPKVVRIRTDLSWEDVVVNYSLENPKQRALSGFYNRLSSAKKLLEGDLSKVRSFFERLARQRGLNPLDADTWYPITTTDIKAEEGGQYMLVRLGWRVPEILKQVFPEIKFSDALFATRTKWPTIEERRDYFMKLARDHGFDPLVADNWYRIKPKALDRHQGYSRVLRMYKFSMRRAVSDVFPDVKFDLSKFHSIKKGYWMQYDNRRKYFIEFANALGFDPLVASNWYGRDAASFDTKSRSIARLFGNSIPHTIHATFPDLAIDVNKFDTPPNGNWQSLNSRKQFFLNFAKAQGFDPLVPENWMNVRKVQICSFRGGVSVLNATNGNLLRTLQLVFPRSKFSTRHICKLTGKHWHDKENRRNCLIEVAQRMGFDPNDFSNWYNLSTSDVKRELKGRTGLLAYYNGNLRTALVDLFPGIDINLFRLSRGPFKMSG